jgi:hypothetical protein
MEAGIDFDAASAAWLANKRRIGGGWYEYVCSYIHTNGKRCNRGVGKGLIEFCKKHRISGRKRTIIEYNE